VAESDAFSQVDDIAEKHLARLRDAVITTWDKWRGEIPESALFDAAINRDQSALMRIVETAWMDAENDLIPELHQIFAEIVNDAVKSANLLIEEQMQIELPSALSRIPNEIMEWARQHTALWITQIGETERMAIRNLITEALPAGRPPAAVAREIRAHIGLNDQQAKTLSRFRAAMEAAGMNQKLLERSIEQRAAKMIRDRAKTIAINEALIASKQGNHMAYQNMIRDGYADAEESRRFWLVAPSEVCPDTCQPIPGMNPEGRRLDEPFATPVGPLMIAHAHVRCRCVAVVRLKRIAA
jgi:hypothetical protein